MLPLAILQKMQSVVVFMCGIFPCVDLTDLTICQRRQTLQDIESPHELNAL